MPSETNAIELLKAEADRLFNAAEKLLEVVHHLRGIELSILFTGTLLSNIPKCLFWLLILPVILFLLFEFSIQRHRESLRTMQKDIVGALLGQKGPITMAAAAILIQRDPKDIVCWCGWLCSKEARLVLIWHGFVGAILWLTIFAKPV